MEIKTKSSIPSRQLDSPRKILASSSFITSRNERSFVDSPQTHSSPLLPTANGSSSSTPRLPQLHRTTVPEPKPPPTFSTPSRVLLPSQLNSPANNKSELSSPRTRRRLANSITATNSSPSVRDISFLRDTAHTSKGTTSASLQNTITPFKAITSFPLDNHNDSPLFLTEITPQSSDHPQFITRSEEECSSNRSLPPFQEFSEEDQLNFNEETKMWTSVVHPKHFPSGRADAVQLSRNLNAMLASLDPQQHFEAMLNSFSLSSTTEEVSSEKRDYSSKEYFFVGGREPASLNTKQNNENLDNNAASCSPIAMEGEGELAVWDAVFAEAVRQVHVVCVERGNLLEQVRLRYLEVFSQMSQRLKTFFGVHQQDLRRIESLKTELQQTKSVSAVNTVLTKKSHTVLNGDLHDRIRHLENLLKKEKMDKFLLQEEFDRLKAETSALMEEERTEIPLLSEKESVENPPSAKSSSPSNPDNSSVRSYAPKSSDSIPPPVQFRALVADNNHPAKTSELDGDAEAEGLEEDYSDPEEEARVLLREIQKGHIQPSSTNTSFLPHGSLSGSSSSPPSHTSSEPHHRGPLMEVKRDSSVYSYDQTTPSLQSEKEKEKANKDVAEVLQQLENASKRNFMEWATVETQTDPLFLSELKPHSLSRPDLSFVPAIAHDADCQTDEISPLKLQAIQRQRHQQLANTQPTAPACSTSDERSHKPGPCAPLANTHEVVRSALNSWITLADAMHQIDLFTTDITDPQAACALPQLQEEETVGGVVSEKKTRSKEKSDQESSFKLITETPAAAAAAPKTSAKECSSNSSLLEHSFREQFAKAMANPSEGAIREVVLEMLRSIRAKVVEPNRPDGSTAGPKRTGRRHSVAPSTFGSRSRTNSKGKNDAVSVFGTPRRSTSGVGGGRRMKLKRESSVPTLAARSGAVAGNGSGCAGGGGGGALFTLKEGESMVTNEEEMHSEWNAVEGGVAATNEEKNTVDVLKEVKGKENDTSHCLVVIHSSSGMRDDEPAFVSSTPCSPCRGMKKSSSAVASSSRSKAIPTNTTSSTTTQPGSLTSSEKSEVDAIALLPPSSSLLSPGAGNGALVRTHSTTQLQALRRAAVSETVRQEAISMGYSIAPVSPQSPEPAERDEDDTPAVPVLSPRGLPPSQTRPDKQAMQQVMCWNETAAETWNNPRFQEENSASSPSCEQEGSSHADLSLPPLKPGSSRSSLSGEDDLEMDCNSHPADSPKNTASSRGNQDSPNARKGGGNGGFVADALLPVPAPHVLLFPEQTIRTLSRLNLARGEEDGLQSSFDSSRTFQSSDADLLDGDNSEFGEETAVGEEEEEGGGEEKEGDSSIGFDFDYHLNEEDWAALEAASAHSAAKDVSAPTTVRKRMARSFSGPITVLRPVAHRGEEVLTFGMREASGEKEEDEEFACLNPQLVPFKKSARAETLEPPTVSVTDSANRSSEPTIDGSAPPTPTSPRETTGSSAAPPANSPYGAPCIRGSPLRRNSTSSNSGAVEVQLSSSGSGAGGAAGGGRSLLAQKGPTLTVPYTIRRRQSVVTPEVGGSTRFTTRNSLLTSILSRHANTPAKSLRWLIRLIRAVYREKIQQDQTCDRRMEERRSMPQFIYQFLLERYGTRVLVERNVAAVVKTTQTYRNLNLNVEVFARFLEESWPTPVLTVFLKAQVMLEEGGRVAEGQTVLLELCDHVTRVVLPDRNPKAHTQFMALVFSISTVFESSSKIGRSEETRRVVPIEFLNLLCLEYHTVDTAYRRYIHHVFAQADPDLDGLLNEKEFTHLIRRLDAKADPLPLWHQALTLSRTPVKGHIDFTAFSDLAYGASFLIDHFRQQHVPDHRAMLAPVALNPTSLDEAALLKAVNSRWVEFRSNVTLFLRRVNSDIGYRSGFTALLHLRAKLNMCLANGVDGSRALFIYRKVISIMCVYILDRFKVKEVADLSLLDHQLSVLEHVASKLQSEYFNGGISL
eukprot:GCRY01003055.1.p1 GENE.GCRY01003055.1~~GCRY01003055.1.p1  ORF type:complete len:1967 (+),score=399.96 GCRY01003055.1:179-6079(+)